MSDEGFLKRWSRRKRTEPPSPAAESESVEPPPSNLPPQAGEGSLPTPSPAQRGKVGMGDSPSGELAREGHDDDAIDPATLPPLESLGPDSDYTVFLKKGVPEALRLAALRKAWASDPFIRDFRSPAIDYGWDFTTPDYALRPGDNVAKLLDQIFSPGAPEPAKSEAATRSVAKEPARVEAAEPPKPVAVPQIQAAPPAANPAPPAEPLPQTQRRKHGGALPGEPD